MTRIAEGAGEIVPPRPRVPSWVTDIVIGFFVIAVMVAPVPGGTHVTPSIPTIVLVITAAVVLPWRRRFPRAVLAITLLLYAGVGSVGILSPGSAMAVAVAAYGVTSGLPRRRALVLTALALIAVVLFGLPAAAGEGFEARIVQFVLVVAAAAAIGDAARSRRQYIVAITERARRAEETREQEARRRVTEERLRIARDLHDVVAHQIAVISLNAGVASSAVDRDAAKAKEALGTIRGAARTVLGEIGDLMAVLRTDEDAVASPPQPGLDDLDDLIARFAASGLDATVRIEGDRALVTGAVGIVAYRVIQEGLTNAHKHGAAHRAHLLITVADDAVDIVITNPVERAAGSAVRDALSTGLGLLGLRERAASVRGSVETSLEAGGWRLFAHLPLKAVAR